MKKITIVLLALLALISVAGAKKHDPADFKLTVHITAVNSEQEYSSRGSVDTDNDGKASGHSSGSTYSVLVYTVKIEGNPVTYQTRRNTSGYSVGLGLHRTVNLHIGDYKARWKKSGILELLYLNDKGEEEAQQLRVVGEQSPQESK